MPPGSPSVSPESPEMDRPQQHLPDCSQTVREGILAQQMASSKRLLHQEARVRGHHGPYTSQHSCKGFKRVPDVHWGCRGVALPGHFLGSGDTLIREDHGT